MNVCNKKRCNVLNKILYNKILHSDHILCTSTTLVIEFILGLYIFTLQSVFMYNFEMLKEKTKHGFIFITYI